MMLFYKFVYQFTLDLGCVTGYVREKENKGTEKFL